MDTDNVVNKTHNIVTSSSNLIVRNVTEMATTKAEEISSSSGGCHSSDMDACNPSHDLIVVSIWSTLVVYGLLANAVIVMAIFRNSSTRQSTSYWLITNLAICDIMMLIVTIAHILPSTALHDDFVGVFDNRNAAAMFLYNVFWYTSVFGLAVMAINRFTSIMYPTSYARVFSARNTVFIVALLYAAGTAVSVPAMFDCCRTLWDHTIYATFYEDDSTPYQYVDLVINVSSSLVMIASYVFIILRVRQSRLMTQRHMNVSSRESALSSAHAISSREMRLFIQFFVVSVVFISTFVTWQVLPRISASKWIYALMTGLFFINNGTNPTVYLIFNTALRQEILDWLRSMNCPLLRKTVPAPRATSSELNGLLKAESRTKIRSSFSGTLTVTMLQSEKETSCVF